MIKLKHILLENEELIQQLIDAGVIKKSDAKKALAVADEAELEDDEVVGDDGEKRKKYDWEDKIKDEEGEMVNIDKLPPEEVIEAIPEYTPPSYIGPEWFEDTSQIGKNEEFFKWLEDNNKGKIGMDFKKMSGSMARINLYPEVGKGGTPDTKSQALSLLIEKGKSFINDFRIHIGNAPAYLELKKELGKLSPPRADKKSKRLIAFGVGGEVQVNIADINKILKLMVDTPEPAPAKEKKSFWDKFKSGLKLTNYLPKDEKGKPITDKRKQKAYYDQKKKDNKASGSKAGVDQYKKDSKARMAKADKSAADYSAKKKTARRRRGSIFN